MKKMSFTLTKIDPELWREFKSACAHYDISMRVTIINYIQNIVEDYLKDRSVSDKLKIKTKKGVKK